MTPWWNWSIVPRYNGSTHTTSKVKTALHWRELSHPLTTYSHPCALLSELHEWFVLLQRRSTQVREPTQFNSTSWMLAQQKNAGIETGKQHHLYWLWQHRKDIMKSWSPSVQSWLSLQAIPFKWNLISSEAFLQVPRSFCNSLTVTSRSISSQKTHLLHAWWWAPWGLAAQ